MNLEFHHVTGSTSYPMPRCHIYHKPTGTLLARDLYQHWHPWLLDMHDSHEVLPAGSFVKVKKNERITCKGEEPGSLMLGCESLMPLPRGSWNGCCGPMGNHKNVLAPDEETPVAWETADCHTPHFIRINPDEWELEQVGHENGVCWVAWIVHQGERQHLRAAYGRDEAELIKRLTPAAEERLEAEARCGSQPGQILNAKIEMADVEDFARSMGCHPNDFQAKVRWLFRKY
ncbi:MAG: hypothetical protein NTV80_12050 [Verrucomicrobia bacterium]|nr:hypothetical protein [Verrucomicrobiota bacterium]